MPAVGNGLWQYECGCIYPIEQKRRELFDAVVRCGRHSLVPSESLPVSQAFNSRPQLFFFMYVNSEWEIWTTDV